MTRREFRQLAARLRESGRPEESIAEAMRNLALARRFWVWECGGWVRLTLRPGQELSRMSGGACEEGFDCWGVTYRNEGGEIICDSRNWGRSCDGGYSVEQTCRLTGAERVDVTARWSPGSWMPASFQPIAWFGEYELHDLADNVRRSTWERVEASQWDEFAEAAGY